MPPSRLPKSDGWTDVAYDLGDDPEDSARIGRILNEACHVFHHHAEGTWAKQDKDAYANLLVAEIRKRPGLAGRLLATDDRVVKMLAHRAFELLKLDGGSLPSDTGRTVFELDGARFSTLESFYDEVSRVLIPGSEWGHNLDAFNDILRGGFGTPEGGFTILWRAHMLSAERLGYPETIRQLELRLERCHPANRASVLQQLAQARRGEGPTVFEWLVEIIRSHGASGEKTADGVALLLE
jgi:hypothetical protein